MSDTVPCGSCPWRRSNPTDGTAIPGFSLTKMRHDLSRTVGDGDAFRPIMACHRSREGGDHTCVGYIAREGWSNLAVRLAAIDGRIPINDIDQGCEGLDLFGSFGEMLAAYEHGALS